MTRQRVVVVLSEFIDQYERPAVMKASHQLAQMVTPFCTNVKLFSSGLVARPPDRQKENLHGLMLASAIAGSDSSATFCQACPGLSALRQIVVLRMAEHKGCIRAKVPESTASHTGTVKLA